MDAGCPARMVTPYGTLTFNQDLAGGGRLQLTLIDGLDGADSRVEVTSLPGVDRALVHGGFDDALYARLEGEIQAPTKEKRTELQELIKAHLRSIRRANAQFFFTQYGQPEQRVDELRKFGRGATFGPEPGVQLRTFAIALVTGDPTIYTV